MAELADWVFCFYDMQEQAYSQGRGISEEMASQTTSALMRWPIAPEAQSTKARSKPQAPGAGEGPGRAWPRSSAPGPLMWRR